MKAFKLIPISALLSLLAGCSNLPKDALVRGLDVGSTSWSPTVKADVIATGAAAKALSAAERAELFGAPRKDAK